MTATTLKVAAAVLAGVSALGFILYRSRSGSATRPRNYYVILVDPSGSASHMRESVVRLAERALAEADPRGDFVLILLRTGDAASANEPVPIKIYHLAANRRAQASQSSLTQRRREIIADVQAQCERLAATDVSPVFYAIKRTSEQMRAEGCGGDSACRLFIQSDLEELVERGIRDAINGVTSKTGLPNPIDNTNIRIEICGSAQTVGQAAGGDRARQMTRERDPRRADRHSEVWSRLFTRPELVKIKPFCTG